MGTKYAYHATNTERLQEIADSGKLDVFPPWHGTDQGAWPDGATQKRAYFNEGENVVPQFAPEEGTPVVIRAKNTAGFRRESTGDLYTTKPVPTSELEYMGPDKIWRSVNSLATKGAKVAESMPDITPDDVGRALEWHRVLDVPVGKERFQAIRGMLKTYLQEESRAPNAAKKFLSEGLLTSVGPSGSASKLPRELRQILGAGADDFAKEVQTGYYYLSGKAPGKQLRTTINNMLNAMQEAGMPETHIAKLRALGPAGIAKMARPEESRAFLTVVQKNPDATSIIRWATQPKPEGPIPTALDDVVKMLPAPPEPKMLPGGRAQKLLPGATRLGESEASASTAASRAEMAARTTAVGAAGEKGLLGKAVGLVGKAGPWIAPAYAAWDIASNLKERGAENQRVADMAATGNIPAELGGNAMLQLPGGKPGEAVSAGQFLQMLQQREDQLKLARFAASTQSADLTRDVLSQLAGGGEEEQRQVQRMRLGAARPADVGAKQPVDKVMKQFDAFLRQATAGGGE